MAPRSIARWRVGRQMENDTQLIPGPPQRFSKPAKEQWSAIPEVLRAEILRMEKEMVGDLDRVRAAAKRDATMDEFHAMAARNGQSLADVIAGFIQVEQIFRQDVGLGLELIAHRMGIDLRAMMRQVVNAG